VIKWANDLQYTESSSAEPCFTKIREDSEGTLGSLQPDTFCDDSSL
jgi:hypothetical protein